MKKLLSALLICFWSEAQVNLTTSDLPIVVINTNGFNVLDNPKIEADMTIFWNGVGKENSIQDSKPHYKGKIGIELRGSSSQIWPKKPYGIELWNSSKGAVSASLFGMPKESDWIFFASYNERSLMHNVLAQKIAINMGLLGSRTQYCELILNNVYQGVYVFMEKIKRSAGRVDISTMTDADVDGDALTGGYIIKIDKTTGTQVDGWASRKRNLGVSVPTYYQYDYPSKINTKQKNYIRNYIDSFESALATGNFTSNDNNYSKYIDMPSFAKFLLVNEISRNVDGYRISTYLYKDKDSKGGKLTAGPAWDFDLTFGNADYCDGNKSTGWAYNFNYVCSNDYWTVPFWWEIMLKDPVFINVLAAEYKKLREGSLSDKNMNLQIDSMQTQLSKAQVRNFTKWNRWGQYDWPIPSPIASSWEGEVTQLRTWLKNRLTWLDNNMPKSVEVADGRLLANENEDLVVTEVFPNPIINQFFVKIRTPQPEDIKLELFGVNGQKVGEVSTRTQAGENTVEVPASVVEDMNGITLLRISIKDKVITKKLVKF